MKRVALIREADERGLWRALPEARPDERWLGVPERTRTSDLQVRNPALGEHCP